ERQLDGMGRAHPSPIAPRTSAMVAWATACAAAFPASSTCRASAGPSLARGSNVASSRLYVPDHDLLALEAPDRGAAAAFRLVRQLLGRAVDLVEGLIRRAVVGVARIGATRPARVGDHARQLPLDVLGGLGQIDRVVVALAHLAAVGAENLRGLAEERRGLGEERAVARVEAAGDLP